MNKYLFKKLRKISALVQKKQKLIKSSFFTLQFANLHLIFVFERIKINIWKWNKQLDHVWKCMIEKSYSHETNTFFYKLNLLFFQKCLKAFLFPKILAKTQAHQTYTKFWATTMIDIFSVFQTSSAPRVSKQFSHEIC